MGQMKSPTKCVRGVPTISKKKPARHKPGRPTLFLRLGDMLLKFSVQIIPESFARV